MINPASITLNANATQTFTTTVNEIGNGPVTWTVDGVPNGGNTVGTLAPQGQAPQAGFLRKAYFSANTNSQTVSVNAGDLVIVSGVGKGTTAYRLQPAGGKWSPEQVWQNRRASDFTGSPRRCS